MRVHHKSMNGTKSCHVTKRSCKVHKTRKLYVQRRKVPIKEDSHSEKTFPIKPCYGVVLGINMVSVNALLALASKAGYICQVWCVFVCDACRSNPEVAFPRNKYAHR